MLNRFSEYGYEIQLNETSTVRAHASFLKLYREDKFSGDPIPLYYHQRTVPDPDAAPDEWNVEQILEHRIRNGVHELKVLWEGYSAEEATWESPPHFFHRVSEPVVKYCQKKGIPLDVTKFLFRQQA